MQGDTELKRVLWYLLGGARGERIGQG